MNNTIKLDPTPVIGMLAWEGCGGNSLSQLEAIPGNILHPETFRYPIKFVRIKGANYRTVVENPSDEVLARMIAAAIEMEKSGVKVITTSCGFNVIFQKKLANAVTIPVLTSSLLQVPLIYQMLSQEQQIGIITADKQHLTEAHLEEAGIPASIPICIMGIENTGEFSKIRNDPEAKVDSDKFIQEVVDTAKRLVSENQNVGAIVLECTDLPPAAGAIRKTVGLPVFDIVTLIDMVHDSFTRRGWEDKKAQKHQ